MREKKRILAGLFAGLLCLASVVGALPSQAYAAETIDTERGVSLTVQCRGEGETPVPSVRFRLYRVAEVSPECTYTLTSDFAGSSVDLEKTLDHAEWKALANTLTGYVGFHSLAPAQEALTDANGIAVFPESGTMETGLYLVLGDRYQIGEYYYFPMPFLVCLPNYLEEQWVYENVTAVPKYDREPLDRTVSRRVWKDWVGGNASARPREIQVALLGDGQEYDRVTLNQANNWEYRWEELDGNVSWQVVEVEMPDHYTVLTDHAGMVFHIINTYHPPGGNRPGGNPPGGGGGGGGDGTPNVPTTTITEDTPPLAAYEPPDSPTALMELPEGEVPLAMLPQTGMLWWPVPVLTICGMVLFLMGWGSYQKQGERDE